MSAVAVPLPLSVPPPAPTLAPLRIGRAFVHPLFDLGIIGGGLSLVFTALLLRGLRAPVEAILTPWLPLIILFTNSAHFAASTVRLYTKPGAMRDTRILTMGFPLIALGVVSLSVWQAQRLGPSLMALYLNWSPFHYAAQSYGLSLMYAYRSGCTLSRFEKAAVRVACLSPFLALMVAGRGVGLDIIGGRILSGRPALDQDRLLLATALGWIACAAPLALFARQWASRRPTLPLISLCAVASNVVWLMTLNRLDAFAFATVFHGLQYLAIVTIFHVKDRLAMPDNRHGWAYHAAGFYGACLTLGYALFVVWPFAYVLLGFGMAESVLLTVAAINLHHFIVDAFIWKLRQNANYKIVTDPV